MFKIVQQEELSLSELKDKVAFQLLRDGYTLTSMRKQIVGGMGGSPTIRVFVKVKFDDKAQERGNQLAEQRLLNWGHAYEPELEFGYDMRDTVEHHIKEVIFQRASTLRPVRTSENDITVSFDYSEFCYRGERLF